MTATKCRCGGDLLVADPTWNESMKKAHHKHFDPALHALQNPTPPLARPLFQKYLNTQHRCKTCGALEGAH